MTTQTLNIQDKGIIIYNAKTNEFFTGLNNWSKQLSRLTWLGTLTLPNNCTLLNQKGEHRPCIKS